MSVTKERMERTADTAVSTNDGVDMPSSFEAISEMRLPFGKHKGKQIKEVPVDYLLWCADAKSGFTKGFREALGIYLEDPSIAADVEIAQSRPKFTGGKKKAVDPVVITFSLPNDNQIDIRLKRRARASEMDFIRQVLSLVETAILESDEE